MKTLTKTVWKYQKNEGHQPCKTNSTKIGLRHKQAR